MGVLLAFSKERARSRFLTWPPSDLFLAWDACHWILGTVGGRVHWPQAAAGGNTERCRPPYLTIAAFSTHVNGFVFVISKSNCLLLVYKNTINFYMLSLYPAALFPGIILLIFWGEFSVENHVSCEQQFYFLSTSLYSCHFIRHVIAELPVRWSSGGTGTRGPRS